MAAAIAGAGGTAAVTRVRTRADVPLAAMPLVFAVQQTIEGFLWLSLATEPHGQAAADLTAAFLLIALVIWPIYAPLAALTAEPSRNRQLAIALCLLGGLAVAIYFAAALGAAPRTARISGAHIAYSSDPDLPAAVRILYPAATCLSLMLSSHRAIALAGAAILLGSLVSYWMYWNAFTSVWCFFAAIASALVLFHFESARRGALAEAERPSPG